MGNTKTFRMEVFIVPISTLYALTLREGNPRKVCLWLNVPRTPEAGTSRAFTYVFGMCPWQKHERNVHYKGMLIKGVQRGAESPTRMTGERRTQRGSRDRLNVTKCHSWKLPPKMVLSGRPRTPAPQDQEEGNLFPQLDNQSWRKLRREAAE